VAGGATVGSGRAYRLDPHTLPARGSPIGGSAAAAFVIEADRAIVRRAGAAVAVPLAEYRGVAVRMEPIGNDGSVRGFVELLHHDAELTLPLAINDDPNSISNDWQAWGRALHLPLLIIGQDGSVGEPLHDTGGVHMGPPKPRRRHSFFAKRRPRFLTRRKVGNLDAVRVVFGDEIFGRD
jgi:hypothetical protein